MTAPAAPSRARLALATVAALALALVVLVLFVLPAEYGIDPTGVGSALGLTRMDDAAAAGADEPEPVDETTSLALQTYASSFTTTSGQVVTRDGYLSEGETALIPFQITQPNVTRVTARLQFADENRTPDGQRTRPDTFEVELKAPTGDVTGGVLARSDATSGGGMAEATYTARAPPHPRELDAASEAEARAAFERNDPPDRTYAGEWTARVTMVEAQDGSVQGAPLPGLPGTAASDDGNTWTLTITVETYAGSVAPKPGTQQRSDTVTLQLAPGGEVEYKLLMALGKRVDYAWRTDGPVVYVDFHGEKSGDTSGAFTRHKSGDFTSDAGSLVAPFDGRHGWFWRNASGRPVTLTLETRGQYDVIGRV